MSFVGCRDQNSLILLTATKRVVCKFHPNRVPASRFVVEHLTDVANLQCVWGPSLWPGD